MIVHHGGSHSACNLTNFHPRPLKPPPSKLQATNTQSPSRSSETRENAEAHRTHEKNLWDILRYAENITDCRRSLVLQYFGERFDRAACRASPGTACDNCLRQGQTVEQEVMWRVCPATACHCSFWWSYVVMSHFLLLLES